MSNERINKADLQRFVDRLATFHFAKPEIGGGLGHDGFYRCNCALASILKDMSKMAQRARYTPTKRRTRKASA